MALHNDRPLGLVNGERGVVTATDDTRIVVRFDQHTTDTTIPDWYVANGSLDHAYAMTVHKAQGLTCDRTYVLGDEHLHREAAYTALSRGRHENRLYTIVPGKYEGRTLEPVDVSEIARRATERSIGKSLAIDQRAQHREHGAELDRGIDIGW